MVELTTSYILLHHVVPAIGSLVTVIMYLAPFKAVVTAGQTHQLGSLNPLPIAMTLLGAVIWTVYGFIAHDFYVGIPTISGIAAATYEIITCIHLMDDQGLRKVQFILVTGATVLPTLGAITTFALRDVQSHLTVWGIAGNVCSCIYYASPLSTMATVIKSKDSSSIYLPMTIMNILNTLMWLIYGAAIGTLLIWMPNTIGLVLSLSQVVLRMLYPVRKPANTLASEYCDKAESDNHYKSLMHDLAPHDEAENFLRAATLVDGAHVQINVNKPGQQPSMQVQLAPVLGAVGSPAEESSQSVTIPNFAARAMVRRTRSDFPGAEI